MTGLFYFLIKQAEFWKRGQFSALFILLPSLFVVAQNDTVRDDQASNYNLHRPERVEWFRNTGTGLFIHFSMDAQLGIVISHSLVGASNDFWSPHEIAVLITRGAMRTPEQVLPGEKSTDPWLSCITMGMAWQYQPTNERYKSGNQLIRLAIEARAKGGSLLLNIGPMADGALPAEQEGRLREMAAWYFINHECMDSVHSWVVSREDSIWFTARDNTLYAIVTGEWKEGERKTFHLHSVRAGPDTRVSVLFSGQVTGDKRTLVKRARFYYRPYAGQVETLYAAPWTATGWVGVDNPSQITLQRVIYEDQQC